MLMKAFLRDNGLSLVLTSIFLILVAGQAITGWHAHNGEQEEHGGSPVPFSNYLKSGHFWEAIFENWESEFLQMAAYILFTSFLFQRGSAESKDPDGPEEAQEKSSKSPQDLPGPVRKGGLRLKIYEHSLSLAFAALFLISFVGHLFAGLKLYNEEKRQHGDAEAPITEYLQSGEFWFESFQNWQSEFLAVLAIVVLSIWLREKNSPESKQVDAPHSSTGK